MPGLCAQANFKIGSRIISNGIDRPGFCSIKTIGSIKLILDYTYYVTFSVFSFLNLKVTSNSTGIVKLSQFRNKFLK